MHNRIYEFIMKNDKALDVEIDDIVNCNADFMIFFANEDNIINKINELKKEIEQIFDTTVHIPSGQIEDQLNDNWEVLNIDFYVNVYDMTEETIEEFFENNFFCDVTVKDNKKECEMNIEIINRSKDWSSFDNYIYQKVEQLKKQGLMVDCDINWRNHQDWDDERIAQIKIYYEDYDE